MPELAETARKFLHGHVVKLRTRAHEVSVRHVHEEDGALHVRFLLHDDAYDDERIDVSDDAVDAAIHAVNDLCAAQPGVAAKKIVIDFEVD